MWLSPPSRILAQRRKLRLASEGGRVDYHPLRAPPPSPRFRISVKGVSSVVGAWCAGMALGREAGDLSHGGFPLWASVSLAVNRIFPPGLVAVTRVKRNHCTEAAHTQEVRREELGADS